MATDQEFMNALEQNGAEIIQLEREIQELKAELETHRWISVVERLPEKEEPDEVTVDCLVSNGRSIWEEMWIHDENLWHDESRGEFKNSSITHWKPIILPD